MLRRAIAPTEQSALVARMTRHSTPLLAACLLVASVAGCQLLPQAEIVTGADGLRTFPVLREIGGAPVLCNLAAAVPPVAGILAGNQADPERLWLEDESGQRLSIVWPQGFEVRFMPDAVLYDERRVDVARAGDKVIMGQVHVGQHAGTFADPYFASGLLFSGCYPRSEPGA